MSAQPSSIRLAGTLALAGLIAGLLLSGIYILTKPRIQRNQAEALRAAIFRVLPGTEEIKPFVIRDGKLVAYDGPPNEPIKGEVVYQGSKKTGEVVGKAIPAEGPGFQDTIKLIYGFDTKRRVVVGMEVLESRETPGLGDKIILDQHFLDNFRALRVEPTIVPVKRGAKTQDNEVDTITGATISAKAVVTILNKSTTRWLPVIAAERQAGTSHGH